MKARRGFDAIVVEGLDETVFDTFDLGARRSIGDILIDKNETNTSTLAAVLRQLWLLKKNLLQYRVISPTVSELLDTLEQEPEIVTASSSPTASVTLPLPLSCAHSITCLVG